MMDERLDFFRQQEMSLSGLRYIMEMSLESKTLDKVAILAIRLERHFAEHGSYPPDLQKIAGTLDLRDLTDPDGNELAYEIEESGRPHIWSKAERENKKSSEVELSWRYQEEETEVPRVPKRGAKKRRRGE